MHREPEFLEAEAQVGIWLDGPARIISEELAQLHSAKNGILQSACSASQKMDADLEKSVLMHTARLMNSLESLKKNGDKSSVVFLKITRQWGCAFQDMELPESTTIFRKSSNTLKPL